MEAEAENGSPRAQLGGRTVVEGVVLVVSGGVE